MTARGIIWIVLFFLQPVYFFYFCSIISFFGLSWIRLCCLQILVDRETTSAHLTGWDPTSTPPSPSDNRKVHVLYVCVLYTSLDAQRMYSLLYSPRLLLSGCFRRDSTSCRQLLTVFTVSSHLCWPFNYFTIHICCDNTNIYTSQKKWLFRSHSR